MAVTGSITTRFIDEKGVDLGKTLIEKDYLISVYPNLLNQFDTPMLMLWGFNQYGQLGDNTTLGKSSPVQTIAYGANWKQVSVGSNHTAAIKTDGTLWTWGIYFDGVLGDNTNVSQSSPVQTVAGGTNWKQVACGQSHTAAIKTDGTLWTWGYNYNGQLGINTNGYSSKSSPVQTVAGGTNWKQVSCGYEHIAAIKTDGTLWTWGYNYNGQLGDNTRTSRSSPVQTVAGGTNWKSVSSGGLSCAATKTDGTLWTWGFNQYGSLGDNTTLGKSSPVQTVTFGTNWKQVACGQSHTAAIKTDGTLWNWGQNSYGSLGYNYSYIHTSSPIQTIARGTNWKQVSCGNQHTAAIKTDGTLWCWGYNRYGALGNNTSGYATDTSSPVQTILYGKNWKSVACGNYMTAAIKDGDF